MAILAIFTGRRITKQMYDRLAKEVDWEGDRPLGLTFHAGSTDESGSIRCAEIWESVDSMNDFVNNRLLPKMRELGISPPKVDVFSVHNINAYPGLDRYKMT